MNIKKTHSLYGSVLSTDSSIHWGLGTLIPADKGGLLYATLCLSKYALDYVSRIR
jgi:hypothetical protein